MKSYTMFVCETCGFETKNREEMKKHEASHLGLTVEEMKTYQELKEHARYMGSVIYSTNNEENQKKFDEAIENLITFEKEHGIKI